MSSMHEHIYIIMLKHALCIHIMVHADEDQKQGVTWGGWGPWSDSLFSVLKNRGPSFFYRAGE